MTKHGPLATVVPVEADADAPTTLGRLGRYIADSYRTCADYYKAAALYEELARLSDAELSRRGLNRATLARDICLDGRA